MLYLRLLIVASIISGLFSCSSLTREEKDLYTITEIDTTRVSTIQNAPGTRDNGVIFPSSRVITEERDMVQRDSNVFRYYPNFIRAGFFESIGTIGGSSDFGIGTGLFGIMPNFDEVSSSNRGGTGKVFTGGIYRFGIFEWRLRWFDDSPSWTYGISAFEMLLPDARGENLLTGISPFYIRKRIFLKDDIPYLTITPSFGISLYPSMYVNLATSLDIGSIGGLNLRTYVGLALGYNPPYLPQIRNNDFTKEGQSIVFPYFGIGASYLDFLNVDEDLEIEWKDYKHSSWNVGFLQFTLLNSNADESVFAVKDPQSAILKGFELKLANANIALPILDYKIYAGTTFFSVLTAGKNNYAISVLPIRIGYWHTLIPNELILEPFLEMGYYPMYSVNLGARLNLRLNEIFNLSLNTGYINASKDLSLGNDILNNLGISYDFSKFYIGISVNFYDRLFDKTELRYFK